MAIRPVKGLNIDSLDKIQKDMVGFNNMIEPYYSPRISIEEVDGNFILVIWVTSGTERPYTVPDDVNAKVKNRLIIFAMAPTLFRPKANNWMICERWQQKFLLMIEETQISR